MALPVGNNEINKTSNKDLTCAVQKIWTEQSHFGQATSLAEVATTKQSAWGGVGWVSDFETYLGVSNVACKAHFTTTVPGSGTPTLNPDFVVFGSDCAAAVRHMRVNCHARPE